jgi:MYXO-CTERM domain-containing protein
MAPDPDPRRPWLLWLLLALLALLLVLPGVGILDWLEL